MKKALKFGACAMMAAGLAVPVFGQIQTAGTLQVDVDATSQPVGALAYLTNNGAMGGVFLATNSAVAGVSPQIIALGGNGTHGVLLDGNQIYLAHYSAATDGTAVLPPAGLTGANPVFSVEVWEYKATINNDAGPVAWGTRNNGQNVACNWGRNTSYGGLSFQGGSWDHGWATLPSAGAWHHLVWTFDGIAVGTNAGTVRLYRDGVLDKAEVQGAPVNVSGAYNILIGAQHNGSMFPAPGGDGSPGQDNPGIVGKVRIHDGVLSAAQVLNNYNYEVASFTNGTPAAFLATAPLHRYSFNLPATNKATGLTVPDTGTAAGAPAVIQGNPNAAAAAWPYFDGGQLCLPNYGNNPYSTNGYVDLPNGLISSLSVSNGGPGAVTLELWVEPLASSATWSELLYIGTAGNGEITGTGTASSGGANGIVIPNLVSGSQEQGGVRGITGDRRISCYLPGARRHIVLTWDEANNLIKIYHEGVQVAQFTANAKMNAIVDNNDWLGRSGWNDQDTPANYREFRVYNRLLSPAEIRRNYLVGPADASDTSTVVWNGNVNGDWNNSTYNWLAGGVATNFAAGDVVQLDDTATGTTTVNLATTVAPKSVTILNSAKNYTITGAGNLSGAATLTKNGTGTLTFTGPQTNDYTGPTFLLKGTTIVTSLANGGVPSALGAASANPTNLVLAGGTLSYQGPATSINRGYQVLGAGSGLDLQNDLTLSGQIAAGSGGSLVKSGAGTLKYTGAGVNALSASTTIPGYSINRGTVIFDGTAGGQTNTSLNEFWVGGSTNYGANLILSNASLTSGSWVSVGRGNGSVGNLSTLTLNNGSITTTANGFSMGYDGLLPGNLAKQITTLNGNSFLNLAGNANIGESTGSFGTLYLNDNSWLKCVTPRLGLNAGATGVVYVANFAAYTNTGYTSIGTGGGTNGPGSGGHGLMVVKDNATWSASGDFNVSDLAYSVGELDISNNPTILVNGAMYIGKSSGTVGTVNQAGGTVTKLGGGDTFLIGGNSSSAIDSVGTWNMSGGTLSVGGNFQPGAYGQGTLNQSGGTIYVAAWTSIGRQISGVGVANLSGGSFLNTNTGNDIIVGELGNGTLNISGTANVLAASTLRIGNGVGASGTVNFDGGTLTTKRIWMGNAGASSVFYFNGGLLQAASGAAADFMSGLSWVSVNTGGARIDTGTNNLTIAQDLNSDYTGGGLTKTGNGSLTLSGYLYYNGPTVVNGGSLGITTHYYGNSSFTLADGTALSLQVLDYAGASAILSGLNLGNTTGASLTFNLGSFGNPPVAPLDASSGTVTANGVNVINITPASSLTVGEIPLISYNTLAGSGSFLLGTLPSGVSAYLTNDTAAFPKFIGLVVTSVFQPRWEGQAGGNWDVQGTTNWIDLITGESEFFYQGTQVVFDDQATGTTSVNLVTNVAPGGVVVNNNALNYTISGPGKITGGGSLTKSGAGSLTLSTTNNAYSGDTVIDGGGTLVSTVANNLGTNSALIIGTGTLSLGANSQKFGSVTLTNGTIASSGATITAPFFNLESGSVSASLAGGSLTTFGTNATDLISVFGVNTYTGRTYLAGSTLAVTNLANGGLPSGVGASSSADTNLIFAGGGLSYNGPAVTIDRGYNVQAGGRLNVSGDVTLTGPITATAGNFAKGGNATLNYVTPGTNVLSRGGGGGAFEIGAGTVVINGGASTPTNYLQTNIVVGELWAGYDQANSARLILTNTSLNVSSWFCVDRGNGTFGSQSVASLYDSLAVVGNSSMGYDNGITGSSQQPTLNLYGNSRLVDAGALYVGESGGSDAYVNIYGNSAVTVGNTFIMGRNTTYSTGTVVVAESASITANANGGWLSVGGGGVGYLTLKDNASVINYRDENVGDVTGSSGLLTIQDNATNLTPNFYVGKSGVAVGVVNQSGGYLGRLPSAPVSYSDWRIGGSGSSSDAGATGTYNLSGGVFEPFSNFQVGAYGVGYWNQSGGIANCGSYPSMGRYPGSTGTLDISGGVFNQTGSGQLLIIGEQGTATLTIRGSGLVNCAGGLSIGHTSTGVGTVNLNGGTLSTHLIESPGSTSGGSGTLNLNGGVIQANASSTTFMSGLTAANVQAGGAIIDSAGYNITISQPLLDGGGNGGLTKNGNGTLLLNGVNTYTGPTLVNAGTLGGSGTIPGVVQVNAGGSLSAGVGAANAQLTLGSSPVLNGALVANVSKNGGSPSADVLNVNAAVALNGALNLVNVGTNALQVGDTFTLLTASGGVSGAFTSTNSTTPGQNVKWNINVAANQVTATVASVMAATPPTLTNSVSGGNLTLTWPVDNIGWTLQVQTNSLATGLGTNWVNVPNSTSVNSVVIPINPANGSVFYRLVYQP